MKALLPVICFLYVICPIDLIPDFIPVIGWADDAAALLTAVASILAQKK